METLRIPLFPLDVVLFPGSALPLHIFESRYKLMIGRCVEEHSPFGLVRAIEQSIASIGCTAIVQRILKTHDDGRLDIIALGESACRIREVHTEKPYLEGDVELLPDDPQPGPASLAEELRSLFDTCHRLIHDNASPDTEDEDEPGASLAYYIAADLPLDLDARQALLEVRAESERRRLLVAQLQQILPELQRIHRVRSKAAGNGYALN